MNKDTHIESVLQRSNLIRINLKLCKSLHKDMAAKLDIHSIEMGPKEEAEGAFEGQQVLVTPLIGKLQVQVQDYVDSEDFYVLPLNHANVLLVAPWFTCLLATLSYPNRVIKF